MFVLDLFLAKSMLHTHHILTEMLAYWLNEQFRFLKNDQKVAYSNCA